MCPSGKVGHPTHWQAENAMLKLWRRGKGKLPCRIYECHLCGKYHLTSKPLRERVER